MYPSNITREGLLSTVPVEIFLLITQAEANISHIKSICSAPPTVEELDTFSTNNKGNILFFFRLPECIV